jgi:uncharacterized protein with HEPN domain
VIACKPKRLCCMPTSEDITRLKHMLEAAQKAIMFTQDRSRHVLDSDEVLALAVVRLLEIIGEASKNISDSIKSKYPAVPWKQIAGTRDRLMHGYFDVDLDIVWEIITSDLPPLSDSLEQILRDEETNG